jgi:hypothetical protein
MTISQLIKLMGYVSDKRYSDPCTEKVDGINMLFKHTGDSIVFARSFTDIKAGGLTLEDLKQRFKDEPEVSETIYDAMSSLTTALAKEDIQRWKKMGWTNLWYSCDVVAKQHANVLVYDVDAIVVHRLYVTDDGKLVNLRDDPFWDITPQVGRWSLFSNPLITGRSPTEPWREAINSLASLPLDLGMPSDNTTTLGDIYRHKVKLLAHDARIPPHVLDDVVARIMKDPGCMTLTQIKKKCRYNFEIPDVQAFVKDERNVMKLARANVEAIVHKFSVSSLKHFSSFLIRDMIAETSRLREAWGRAVDMHEGTEYGEFTQKQVQRLGNIENINSAVEGVVIYFDEKKNFYKFTVCSGEPATWNREVRWQMNDPYFISSAEELRELLSKFESSKVYTYRESQEAIRRDPWKGEKEQGQGAGDVAICYDLGHLETYSPGNDLDCQEFFLENKDVLQSTGGLGGTFHFASAGARALDWCKALLKQGLMTHLFNDEVKTEELFSFLGTNVVIGSELPKSKFDALPEDVIWKLNANLTASNSIHEDCKWVAVHGHTGNVLIFSIDLIDRFFVWSQTITRGAAKFKLTKEGRDILYAMRDKYSPNSFTIDSFGEILDERNFVALSEPITHQSARDVDGLRSIDGPTSNEITLPEVG